MVRLKSQGGTFKMLLLYMLKVIKGKMCFSGSTAKLLNDYFKYCFWDSLEFDVHYKLQITELHQKYLNVSMRLFSRLI